jgi:DNA-binding response OmpR family regulator
MADIAIGDAAPPRMGTSGLIRRLAGLQSLPELVLVRLRNDLDEIRYLNDDAADVIERTASGEVWVARANVLLRRSAPVSPAQQDEMRDQPALHAGPLSLQSPSFAFCMRRLRIPK